MRRRVTETLPSPVSSQVSAHTSWLFPQRSSRGGFAALSCRSLRPPFCDTGRCRNEQRFYRAWLLRRDLVIATCPIFQAFWLYTLTTPRFKHRARYIAGLPGSQKAALALCQCRMTIQPRARLSSTSPLLAPPARGCIWSTQRPAGCSERMTNRDRLSRAARRDYLLSRLTSAGQQPPHYHRVRTRRGRPAVAGTA